MKFNKKDLVTMRLYEIEIENSLSLYFAQGLGLLMYFPLARR